MSPHLGVYGDAVARTPTLDRFAAQSIRFTHAFSTAPVCAPSRAAIITGHVSGGDRRAAHAHDRGSGAGAAGSISRGAAVLRQGIPRVPARGRLLHQQPREDRLPVRGAVHDLGRPRRLARTGGTVPIPRSRSSPCSTSRSRTRVRASQQPGAQGETGRDQSGRDQSAAVLSRTARWCATSWRGMYDNIADMDGQVAEILRQLDEDGLADNTIVFYWSDHGDGVPRAKRSLYDSGLRVPLMMRIPPALGRGAAPGTVRDDLVSLVDLAPTVLALAGVDVPAHMQGRVLVGPRAGAGPALRVRCARSHGRRIRHDAIGPRRAVPLYPQLLAGAAVRRPHHLSQPERDHAGVAQDASGVGAPGPAGALDADQPSGGGALRRAPRSAPDREPRRRSGAPRHSREDARRRRRMDDAGWETRVSSTRRR